MDFVQVFMLPLTHPAMRNNQDSLFKQRNTADKLRCIFSKPYLAAQIALCWLGTSVLSYHSQNLNAQCRGQDILKEKRVNKNKGRKRKMMVSDEGEKETV
jgi:hypothetical protein